MTTKKDWPLRLSKWAVAIVPSVAVLSSYAMVPLLAFWGFWGLWVKRKDLSNWRSYKKTSWACWGAFYLWCGVSACWSENPIASLTLTFRLFCLFSLGTFAFWAALELPNDRKAALSEAFGYGFIFALFLLLLELYAHAPLTKTFKAMDYHDFLNLSRFNMGASFLLIAGLAWFSNQWHKRAHYQLYSLLLLLLVAVFSSESESAKFAAIVAILMGFFFFSLGRRHWKALQALSLCLFLLSPFVIDFSSGWIIENVLPTAFVSGDWRIHIWNYVVGVIFTDPLRGLGLDASRFYSPEAFTGYQIELLNGDVLIGKSAIPLHPHNAVLQIWLELGAIGAAIIACGAFVFIGRLKALTVKNGRVSIVLLQMSLISFSIVAELGYGIWQNRWIACFVMAMVIWALTLPQKEKSS